jgi:hypothetical protein
MGRKGRWDRSRAASEQVKCCAAGKEECRRQMWYGESLRRVGSGQREAAVVSVVCAVWWVECQMRSLGIIVQKGAGSLQVGETLVKQASGTVVLVRASEHFHAWTVEGWSTIIVLTYHAEFQSSRCIYSAAFSSPLLSCAGVRGQTGTANVRRSGVATINTNRKRGSLCWPKREQHTRL